MKQHINAYLDPRVISALRDHVYSKKAKGQKISISTFIEQAVIDKLRAEGANI